MRLLCALAALALMFAMSSGPAAAQDKYKPLKPRAELKGHTSDAIALAFSPDGAVLASTGADDTVRLWDVKAGKEMAVLKGHQKWALALAFSADGKLLASGDQGGTVRLWDVKAGKEVRTITAHKEGVRAVAFSPDGKLLATTGQDRVLRLWDVGTGAEKVAHKAGGFGAHPLAFSPDGKLLAYGESLSAFVYDIANDKATPGPRHGNAVMCLTFAPGGKTFLSGGFDDKLTEWTAAPPKEKRVFAEGHVGGIASARFSPDGKTLFTIGNGDGRFLAWDVTSGKPVRFYALPGRAAHAVTADGSVVASVEGLAVKLWDVPAK